MRHNRFKTLLLFLLFSGTLIPPNFMGYAFRTNITRYEPTSHTESATKQTYGTTANNNGEAYDDKDNESQTSFCISNFLLSATMITTAISTILILLLLAYFANQPISKGCILMDLYKDTLRIFLVATWTVSISMIICKVNHDGMVINADLAKCISCIIVCLHLQTLATLNIIGVIRLCMAKQKVLDPITLWIGDDDASAMKKIRIITLGLPTCLTVVLGINDIHSVLYYSLIGDADGFANMPNGILFINATIILLNSGLTILMMGTWIYGIIERQNNRAINTLAQSTEACGSEHILDSYNLRSTFKHLPFLFMVFLLFAILLHMRIPIQRGRIWWVLSLLIFVLGVLTPMYMFIINEKLRSYGKQILNDAKITISDAYVNIVMKIGRCDDINSTHWCT